MAWYDTPSIDIGRGQLLTPFWHCFGANACRIDEPTILAMLMQSRTNLFPINTHDLTRGLIIGNGSVHWHEIRRHEIVNRLVPCLNINLRTTAVAAVEVARQAFGWTGIDLLKLEVLNEDMKVANDDEVVRAATVLADEGFRVMPLITANPDAARALFGLGCPLVRVQGSPIGSGRGIADPQKVMQVVALDKPVILDCGIGTAAHVLEAMSYDCAGFLVDHLLFKDGDPVEAVRELRKTLDGWRPGTLTEPEYVRYSQLAATTEDAAEWHEWAEQVRPS